VLRPIERRSVSGAVFDQLAENIVSGVFPAGTPLPSERELVRQLGVNRGAVREAVQRLSQARLVDVRHGDTTRVLDFRRHAGLELLERLLVMPNGRPDLEIALGVLEMRAALGPEIAAACARRQADAPDRAALLETLDERVRALTGTRDLARRQAEALDLWDAIVEGTANLAYRLAFNSLRRTYERLLVPLRTALQDELRADDDYLALVAAVRAGKDDAAAASACASI
jgi:DNA-binding FadR family transcriptional regulator